MMLVKGTLLVCCWLCKGHHQHFLGCGTVKSYIMCTLKDGTASDSKKISGFTSLFPVSTQSAAHATPLTLFFQQFSFEPQSESLF